jgi:hypothetical protein
MYKGIPLVKNDFLVKPELSAARVLLLLPWAAVDASLRSLATLAPVTALLPAEGRVSY